jgi:integrase
VKSRSRKRTPTIVNLTVKRRYLTEREVERLMDCARKYGRYGHRDATMILVAYRHGLRASEVCDLQWQQIELSEGRLHVHRVKDGIASVHPIRGDMCTASRTGLPAYIRSAVTRYVLFVGYAATTSKMPTYSFPNAGAQSVLLASTASSSASTKLPRCAPASRCASIC